MKTIFKTMNFSLHNKQIGNCNARIDLDFAIKKYKTSNLQTALQYVIANDELRTRQFERREILFSRKVDKAYIVARTINASLDADVLDYAS